MSLHSLNWKTADHRSELEPVVGRCEPSHRGHLKTQGGPRGYCSFLSWIIFRVNKRQAPTSFRENWKRTPVKCKFRHRRESCLFKFRELPCIIFVPTWTQNSNCERKNTSKQTKQNKQSAPADSPETDLLFFLVSCRGWNGLCPTGSSPWIAVRSCILKLRKRSVIAPWLYLTEKW